MPEQEVFLWLAQNCLRHAHQMATSPRCFMLRQWWASDTNVFRPFFHTISTVSHNLFSLIFPYSLKSCHCDHHYTEFIMGLIKAGIMQNTLIW